ncbi:methyl-accepting chemotaxis protein [Chromobacterium sp. IIBBL 290-4]|uniref:methyl-accepting chemotaxis protein n=1 Tax=Chromobacterium sp. IIBBL 290-4 TaxID=2953890 RepID=UPI0020B7289E|nr:methyl-accepting chemotaxis protein [Chromobacterium sp. IIBBL 290-4]UTH73255.1 methyl-accepting chemotaxis protein [Chromobacterium sp. IIBBL 290-4]
MSWFHTLQVRTKLLLSFGVLMVLLVAMGIVGYQASARVNAGLEDLFTNQFSPLVGISNARVSAMTHNRALYRYLAEMDKAKMEEAATHMDGYDKDLFAQMKIELSSTMEPEEAEANRRWQTQWPIYLSAAKEAMKLAYEDSGNGEGRRKALDIVRSKARPAFDIVEQSLATVKETNEKVAERTHTLGQETYASTTREVIGLSLVSLFMCGLLSLLVTRSILRQLGGDPSYAMLVVSKVADGDLAVPIKLRDGDSSSLLFSIREMAHRLSDTMSEVSSMSESIGSASEQVASTASSLAQTASELASSVEETSASVEEMASTVTQNADNARVTDGIATKSASSASESGKAVGDMVHAMKEIASKITAINDIANKTDLLAINAAIEAARAGEHGKGFATVAVEVRKLAERSQVAAREIGDLAGRSVGVAERAGVLLQEMLPGIDQTASLVQEISAASREQRTGIDQINTAVTQISTGMQTSASSAEELSSTSEELSSAAMQLQDLMQQFKLRGGGRGKRMLLHASHGSVKKTAAKIHRDLEDDEFDEGDLDDKFSKY